MRPVRRANEPQAQVGTVYSDSAPEVVNITSGIITHDFVMHLVHEEDTSSVHSSWRGDGGSVSHIAGSGKGPSLVIELL